MATRLKRNRDNFKGKMCKFVICHVSQQRSLNSAICILSILALKSQPFVIS